ARDAAGPRVECDRARPLAASTTSSASPALIGSPEVVPPSAPMQALAGVSSLLVCRSGSIRLWISGIRGHRDAATAPGPCASGHAALRPGDRDDPRSRDPRHRCPDALGLTTERSTGKVRDPEGRRAQHDARGGFRARRATVGPSEARRSPPAAKRARPISSTRSGVLDADLLVVLRTGRLVPDAVWSAMARQEEA